MSGLQDISRGENCFFPRLLDIITPLPVIKGQLTDIFLVMDLEDTDLRLLMKHGSNLQFGKEHVKTILYNIICAANFMAKANVIHRDIKPANILLNRYCQVKICDFGLART